MPLTTVYRKSPEVIVSYNWIDVVAGSGFVSFYLAAGDDGTYYDYILSDKQVSSSVSTIPTNISYEFISSSFNSPRTIHGTANLVTYADYASGGGITIGAEIFIMNDVNMDTSVGAVTTDDPTTYGNNTTSFVTVKTYTVDDWVHKFDFELGNSGGEGYVTARAQITFTYYGGDTYVEVHSSGGGWEAKSVDNPRKDKKVSTIIVALRVTGVDTGTAQSKNQEIYGILTNPILTSISDEVTSRAADSDRGVLLKIPLTKTSVKIGEKLYLKLTKGGGTGSYTIDPLNLVSANQTTILNIPFQVDI